MKEGQFVNFKLWDRLTTTFNFHIVFSAFDLKKDRQNINRKRDCFRAQEERCSINFHVSNKSTQGKSS